MNTRQRSYKKAMSVVLIATNLLSVVPAEAGLLDWMGLGSTSNEEAPAAEPATQPSAAHPAAANDNVRPARPLARLAARLHRPRSTKVDLSNGDDDGVNDDYEKEQKKLNKITPEDARFIGPATAADDTPLYSGGGESAKVIGTVKKGESFSVVYPGEKASRVRFSDGRLGFVDQSKIVRDTSADDEVTSPVTPPVPPTQPAVKKSELPNKQKTTPKKKLEADCDSCRKEVKTPKAIDDKKVGGIADVSKHLNRKQAGGSALKKEKHPSAADEITKLSKGKVAKLSAAARHQALKPRVPATYLWRRLGRKPVGGNRSKGKCYRAVKEALVQAGIVKGIWADESAVNAHRRGFLKRMGMKNVMSDVQNKYGRNHITAALNAPAGSVLVYEGGSHGHGHIEIKTDAKQYCSDFCSVNPVNHRNTRRLVAIYVP